MSVTASALPKIAWSRNPLELALTSNNFKALNGAAAIVRITFTGAVAPGEQIRLTWSAKNLVLTAAVSPDDSGLEFPSGDGSDAYVASLIDIFRSNLYVSQDFLISSATNILILAANKPGAEYNITPVTTTHFTITLPTPGVTEVIKTNFGHLLAVLEVSTDKQLYSRTLNLNNRVDGKSNKDLAEIVDNYLGYDIPDPSLVWQLCTKSLKAVYLKYAQVYGDIPEAKRTYATDPVVFCLGGYSKSALGVITDGQDHLAKYLLPDPALYEFQRWFESFPVDGFEVRTNQPQFLYFINMRSATETLAIKVTVTYADQTTAVVTRAGGSLNSLQKVTIAAGYRQLSLDAVATAAGKQIISYKVQLIEATSATPRSLIKSFTVNRSYEEFTRYILYSDSAGNFKTLRAFGRSQLTADISDTTANSVESARTPFDGSINRFDVYLVQNDELNTGYLIGDQRLDALAELMLAEKAFRVFGHQLVPILITGKKFGYEADSQNLNAMKLEYRLAYDERLYTGSTGALIIPQLNQSQQSLDDI